MNCFEILEKIEQNGSKNVKLGLLNSGLEVPGMAFLVCATFDYRRKYYVRDLAEVVPADPAKKVPDSPRGWLALIESFDAQLQELESSGRTQETKNSVRAWLEQQAPEASKWFRRVILRDLRCGFSVDSCVKAGFKIPTFELQLATDAKKCKKLEAIVKAGVWVSRKLDGNRCLAHGIDGVFTLYSRNGTVYENFPMIRAELARLWPEGEVLLDGEIMSDDFQSMQKSAFANKRKTVVGAIYYNVFDTIPPDEWAAVEFSTWYNARYRTLTEMFRTRQSEMVRLVEHTLVFTIEEVRKLQAQYEGEGFEGAMVNPTNMEYYLGRRTNSVMKFKSMLTWDCEITGFHEGNGRLAGTLGKMSVRQENGNLCDVGTGLSDEDREYIWKNQDLVRGRIAEIKYQELTPDGIMRFPVFMRFRNWEAGEGKL